MEHMSNSNVLIRKSTRQAFTLIELLLVLVILGVLAAIVVPKFAGRGEQARKVAAGVDIKAIDDALDVFEQDNERYPTSEEGLQSLMAAPSNCPNWKGPYLKKLPQDPWGHAYIYRFPGQHTPNSPDISSAGADGQEGTSDDITNWSDNKPAQ